jgi:tetratricopeptide (TPR) repeat protein
MLGVLKRTVVFAVATLALAPVASAESLPDLDAPPPRVATSPEAHARAARITNEAQAHYKAERYEEAAAAYQRAYAVVPAPELLFNLGQCQRLLARPHLAIKYFEAYLRLRPDSPQRVLVEQLIAEARALPAPPDLVAAQQGTSEPSAAPVPPVQRIVVAGLLPLPEHEAEPRTRLLTDERYADHDSTKVYETWWFWTAIAAVAAGAAVTTYVVLENQGNEAPSGSLGKIEWD